jgi:type IX secretion system substrate protein
MKKLFSSISTILIFAASYSQSGYSYEIVNNENVRKQFGPITSDNDGNTIISGQFETTITLGGITLINNSPSPGSYNTAFVAKQLPGGSFAWAKMFTPLSIPGGTSSITVQGINTDATGNIYVTGDFIGKIGFGVPNVSLGSTKNGSVYTRDIFTLKMSSVGTVVWARSTGTANDGCNAGESGTSVTTDNAGNVYVTGQIVWKVFKNTTVCNEIPGGSSCSNATSKSITCPYVVKYSAAGNKIWERKYVNNGALVTTSCWYNHPQGTNIRTDGTDIYVNGYFYGTVDFGTGPLSTGSETTGNSFLIKLTSNGTTLWSRSVTGGANNPFGVGDDLFVDGNDIYISGIYSGNISFGACSLGVFSPPAFFAKYSSSGTCQWAITPGGISYGVVRHPNGNLAMLRRGRFYSIREFSPLDGSLIDSTVTPLADTATASIWGYPSFAKLPDGFIFSHHIQGTLHFGDLTITSTGSYDNMMLIRYTAPAPPVARMGNIIPETSSNKMVLYPNPASNQITIQNNSNKLLGTLSIYDITGKMNYKKFVGAHQTTIDVKNFSAGVYYIRSDQLQTAIKFVKQ